MPDRDRTLEVHCRNCGARFVAWYGSEEDADTEVKDVDKCGLCGGDPFKKDNFKDAVLRLIPYVTARNVKWGR
jgi:hypothetical protein